MRILRYKQFENKEYGKDFTPEEIKKTFGIPKETFEEDLEVLFSDAFGPDVKPSVTYNIFNSNLLKSSIYINVTFDNDQLDKYFNVSNTKGVFTAFGITYPHYNFKNESQKIDLENDIWDLIERYGLDSGNFICDVTIPNDLNIFYEHSIKISITKHNNATFESVTFKSWYKDDSSPQFIKREFGVNREEIEDLLTPIVDEYENMKISIGFRCGKGWDSGAIVSQDKELKEGESKLIEIDVEPNPNSLTKDNYLEVGRNILNDVSDILSKLRGYRVKESSVKNGYNPSISDILCWFVLEKE